MEATEAGMEVGPWRGKKFIVLEAWTRVALEARRRHLSLW